MQQPAPRSLDRLEALTELAHRGFADHELVRRLRAGSLTLREYTLLVWGLRCWHMPIEDMVWDSRSETVRRVRAGVQRKIPMLERDLVAVCGKELVVPAELNRTLAGFAQLTARGTTPARMLGRAFILETVFVRVAGAAPAVQQALALPVAATHYLRGCVDPEGHLADVAHVFASGLVGEVPLQNALEGARELVGQAHELFDAVARVTTRQAAAS